MTEEELYNEQIDIEEKAIEHTNQKYIKGVIDAISQGRFSDMPQGQQLLQVLYEPVKQKIEEYLSANLRGGSGKHQRLIDLCGTPEELAYITISVITNEVIKHNNLIHLSSLAREIGSSVKKLGYFTKLKKDNPKLQAYLGTEYRRASARRKNQLMNKHIRDVYKNELTDLKNLQNVKIGATLIDLVLLSNTDILKKLKKRNTFDSRKFSWMISFTPEVVELIMNVKGLPSVMMKPMIVEPKDWTTYNDGGYINNRLSIIKRSHYLNRSKIKQADYSKVLPIINKLQKTSWRVNERVYKVIKYIFENNLIDPTSSPELPRLYGKLPTPNVITAKDIVGEFEWVNNPDDAKKAEYGIWNKKRERIMIGLDGEVGRRIQFMLTMQMAKDMLKYERFWYVYTVDYRGRVYPYTDFLTPQSKGFTKSMLEFSEGRYLSDEGLYWFKIHTANCYGLDKESFGNRIRWFDENEGKILRASENAINNLSSWVDADSPYEFLSACYAYRDYKDGKPIHLPIQLDAVNSGVQFYSGLLRDAIGAEATCVIGMKRSDLYQKVADRVNEKLEYGEFEQYKEYKDSEGKLLRKSTIVEANSLKGNFTRSMTKKNVMTVPYSVTYQGMKNQNWDTMEEMEREGKAFWNGDRWVVNYLWTELTRQSIFEIVSGARIGQEYLRDLASVIEKPAVWHTPLYNFPVFQPSFKSVSKRVVTPLGSFEVRLAVDKFSRNKQLSSIAANYIHSIDATLLLYCVDNASNDIGVIHDCFLVHANDASEIRNNYKEGYIKIMESDPLKKLSKELDPEGTLEVPCINTLDLNKVRSSMYIIS